MNAQSTYSLVTVCGSVVGAAEKLSPSCTRRSQQRNDFSALRSSVVQKGLLLGSDHRSANQLLQALAPIILLGGLSGSARQKPLWHVGAYNLLIQQFGARRWDRIRISSLGNVIHSTFIFNTYTHLQKSLGKLVLRMTGLRDLSPSVLSHDNRPSSTLLLFKWIRKRIDYHPLNHENRYLE